MHCVWIFLYQTFFTQFILIASLDAKSFRHHIKIHRVAMCSSFISKYVTTKSLLMVSSCPEDFKINPGAVEAICEHPKVPSRLLIGYNRGLVVLWDRIAAAPTHTFVSNQQLESLCWNDEGRFGK